MNTSKKSATTYLVTFATIVALPFAMLHAGGDSDSYQHNSAANPTEPSTNGGQNDPFATTNDAAQTGTATRDQVPTRDPAVIGPEIDGPSRSGNGVARIPNEARAEALDVAIRAERDSTEASDSQPNDLSRNHNVRDAYGMQQSNAHLNHDDAVEMQLNTEATARNIESAEFDNRDYAITLAESGVTEGKQIVLALRTTGSNTTPEARQELDKAMRKVEQAEQKLNGAISSGRRASESRWDNARTELADRYEDYSAALENAREVAVDGGVRFQSHVNVDTGLRADRS